MGVEMANTAIIELADQIESIRLEASNEGYAAAMRAVAEFSTSGTAKPKATSCGGSWRQGNC
jgi:hypothetical protein